MGDGVGYFILRHSYDLLVFALYATPPLIRECIQKEGI